MGKKYNKTMHLIVNIKLLKNNLVNKFILKIPSAEKMIIVVFDILLCSWM